MFLTYAFLVAFPKINGVQAKSIKNTQMKVYFITLFVYNMII